MQAQAEARNKQERLSPTAADIDFSPIFTQYKAEYEKSQMAVETNFRELVKFRSGIDRFTHLLHSYPAKLLLNIPYFFLRCSELIPAKGIILDPFCGSGTVLLESILAGHKAIGADANPLARLITKVKVTPINPKLIRGAIARVLRRTKSESRAERFRPQPLVNWDYWFSDRCQKQLSRLKSAIAQEKNLQIRSFLEIAFSNCIRKSSYADPNVSVPVKLNAGRYLNDEVKFKKIKNLIRKKKSSDVIDLFKKIALNNLEKSKKLYALSPKSKLVNILEDARKLTVIQDDSVDMIISSPPYAGAQKYIRSSSLNLGWLEMCPQEKLRSLEEKNIGREHYKMSEYKSFTNPPVASSAKILKDIFKINPLRAHIASNYLHEMKAAILECHRVLKKGHYMVLVMGNNQICGHDFMTSEYISDLCVSSGFKKELVLRDAINSRGLMTKRNKTAGIISCEWVMIFSKKR
jgi:site-specific DNA-adenine methylase